jgi:hypothetical protein
MNTTANLANFEGQKPVIDPNDAVMLLIDHQSGLFQTVGDISVPELRARAAALAKMATLANLPVITTASVPEGPNGPLIPEIHQNAPHAKYVARKGEINAMGHSGLCRGSQGNRPQDADHSRDHNKRLSGVSFDRSGARGLQGVCCG